MENFMPQGGQISPHLLVLSIINNPCSLPPRLRSVWFSTLAFVALWLLGVIRVEVLIQGLSAMDADLRCEDATPPFPPKPDFSGN